MIIIGLTGSIGMGKSFVAKRLRQLGVPVFDADKEVHRLLATDTKAIAEVAKIFPGAKKEDYIDRKLLADLVYKDKKLLHQLELILHRRVRQAEMSFIRSATARGKRAVVMDIPLLYETGFERYCDYVIVVMAPPFIQRHRVMGRRGLAEEKFVAINKRQLSVHHKKRRADFVINTGLEKGRTVKEVTRIYNAILTRGKRLKAHA